MGRAHGTSWPWITEAAHAPGHMVAVAWRWLNPYLGQVWMTQLGHATHGHMVVGQARRAGRGELLGDGQRTPGPWLLRSVMHLATCDMVVAAGHAGRGELPGDGQSRADRVDQDGALGRAGPVLGAAVWRWACTPACVGWWWWLRASNRALCTAHLVRLHGAGLASTMHIHMAGMAVASSLAVPYCPLLHTPLAESFLSCACVTLPCQQHGMLPIGFQAFRQACPARIH